MDKKERDDAVAEEAENSADICIDPIDRCDTEEKAMQRENYVFIYKNGTLSRAHTEWVVRRAVDMARERTEEIDRLGYLDSSEWLREVSDTYSTDEILAEILKELENGR